MIFSVSKIQNNETKQMFFILGLSYITLREKKQQQKTADKRVKKNC